MSKIEWTDSTWNPIVGCAHCSPGCQNCYAERIAYRIGWGGLLDVSYDTLNKTELNAFVRKTRIVDNYKRVIDKDTRRFNGLSASNPYVMTDPIHWKKPRKIFVCSMGDLFYYDCLDPAFLEVFRIMNTTPHHIFQLLTKRPENAAPATEILTELYHRSQTFSGEPVWTPNIWLGVTVCNQAEADEKIPLLLATPAAVKFVSLEPLLGPVDIAPHLSQSTGFHMSASIEGLIRNQEFSIFDNTDGGRMSRSDVKKELFRLRSTGARLISFSSEKCEGFSDQTGCPGHPTPRLDWVILGAETGPHKRPMNLDWARSIRDQCAAAGIPFFFKKDSDGKSTLDGITHHEFPKGAAE